MTENATFPALDYYGGNQPIMLLSGGFDSYMVWRLLNRPPGLYFITGARVNKRELASIEKIKKAFPDADLRTVERFELGRYEKPSGYVPYRNLLFILYASLEAPGRDLIFGQIREWQTDKNRDFFNLAGKLVKDLGYMHIKVYAPYDDMTRSDALKEYLERGFDPKELTRFTYSCLHGDDQCGRCSSCIGRWIAMTNNGLSEKMQTTPTRAMWRDNARAQRHLFRWSHAYMYWARVREANRAFDIAEGKHVRTQ